jgi:hypothetical protein
MLGDALSLESPKVIEPKFFQKQLLAFSCQLLAMRGEFPILP